MVILGNVMVCMGWGWVRVIQKAKPAKTMPGQKVMGAKAQTWEGSCGGTGKTQTNRPKPNKQTNNAVASVG